MTEAELVGQIEPLLSETMQVKTAAAQASADSADTQEGLNIIKYFLLGFGGIALFVGSFVIANTLAITVAQRMRELATLRTLGASRRQVLGSVMLESLAIGLVGSVIGLFLGLGIAVGLMALLEAIGIDLPSGGLVFSMRTIVVSLGVGTLIAVLASLRPAVRATRIEPIAAVREGAVMPASRFARYAVPVSAVVGVIAIALFSYGVFASGVDVVVRVIVARRRRALHVRRRRDDRLARRAPARLRARRTRRTLRRHRRQPGAPERGPEPGQDGVDGGRGDDRARPDHVRRRDRPGVQDLVHGCRRRALRRRLLRVGRKQRRAADQRGRPGGSDGARRRGGVRDALGRGQGRRQDRPRHRRRREPDEGRRHDLVERLQQRPRGARPRRRLPRQALRRRPLARRRLAPDGQDAHRHELQLRVDGIVEPPKGGSPFGEVSVSTATFDGAFANHDNDLTLLNIEGGPSAENTAALEKSLAAFPAAVVETREEFKDTRTAEITQSLQILYALLGLSVIVSLFGVINTLVLSVFERTRELGMLRAIGMTRRQVRRMIRHESIVTALIGAALGIARRHLPRRAHDRRALPVRDRVRGAGTGRSSSSSASRSSRGCWPRSCRPGVPRG